MQRQSTISGKGLSENTDPSLNLPSLLPTDKRTRHFYTNGSAYDGISLNVARTIGLTPDDHQGTSVTRCRLQFVSVNDEE